VLRTKRASDRTNPFSYVAAAIRDLIDGDIAQNRHQMGGHRQRKVASAATSGLARRGGG
jgi:hypothetical protein